MKLNFFLKNELIKNSSKIDFCRCSVSLVFVAVMAVSVSSSIIPGIKLNSILNLKSRDILHGNYGARSPEGLQAADTCCSQWQIRPVNAICWRFLIWVFHWNEWGTGRRQEKAVCTTAQCVLAAADLLQAMDPTADPCQDFFEFACGGWIKKHPIPDSKSRWTQFDSLRDELTAFLRGKSALCSICLWWDDGRNIFTESGRFETFEQVRSMVARQQVHVAWVRVADAHAGHSMIHSFVSNQSLDTVMPIMSNSYSVI